MTSKEQEMAGTGCILQFFKDLYECIDNVNSYKIGMDEIELKFPKPADGKASSVPIPDDIQLQARQYAVYARNSIMRCQIQLLGVNEVVKGFDLKKIEELYKKIYDTPTPEPKDCQDYVTELFKGFTSSILKDMLRNVDAYSDLIKE